MSIRDKILEAAACVYARHGFKGATTRLIATEAGVNEVTIFRTFGSKAALINEAVEARSMRAIDPLPDLPVDPQRELGAWAGLHLDMLRECSPLIRVAMAELVEHGDQQKCMTEGHTAARDQLCAYVDRLRERGFAESSCDRDAAVSMLLGAIFADAMGREVMPKVFPQPVEQAAERYTRAFLRAIAPATATQADLPKHAAGGMR